MLRSLASIAVGYLLTSILTAAFATVANGLFHPQQGTIAVQVLELMLRFLAAVAGGYATARIAGTREVMHALVLGGILTLIALFFMPANTSAIFRVLNVLIYLPAMWAGGAMRRSRRRTEEEEKVPGTNV